MLIKIIILNLVQTWSHRPSSAAQSAFSRVWDLTSLFGHCSLYSLQTFTHVSFLLSLGNFQISHVEWRENTAQRQGRNELLDAETLQVSSCWELAGELYFLSPWIWVRTTARLWFFQKLLEIVSSGVEHKEGAQISETGMVALKLKDFMWEERSRQTSQKYARQCQAYIKSVPNPGQEERSSSLCHSDGLTIYSAWDLCLTLFIWFRLLELGLLFCTVPVSHGAPRNHSTQVTKGHSTKAEDRHSRCGQVNWNHQGFGWRATLHAILIWCSRFPQGGWWRDWQKKNEYLLEDCVSSSTS